MLQLKHISKKYRTGDLAQVVLNDVSLNFRDCEFVSILGPSGSGKTTLLNIIGGLDRYDSGEMIINGTSTKDYKDRDWDSYRNHTVGFVFQSYNLIPHQSVLSNVESALTISGVSKSDRRERAKKMLEKVGLGDHLNKRPNQLSGGQMQRVAIARALVNNPDIVLADEPTGALDSETSIQIMELLKEVAKDRLVVMVTHNAELAEQYSTRIVHLRDGEIRGDSDPYDPRKKQGQQGSKKMGRARMSFSASLSLSFHNLGTKKGRTLLTAFAGSIGIIGIALILALSSSVNNYISGIQKETMTSYPISISTETVDMSSMASGGLRNSRTETEPHPDDGVYADYSNLELTEGATASVVENNLTDFKEYLDDPNSEIQQYLGENGVVYSYPINMDVYSYDSGGVLVNTNADAEDLTSSSGNGGTEFAIGSMGSGTMMMGSAPSQSSGADSFSELMVGTDGATVSQVLKDSYDVLYGSWPEEYDQVVLVLDENNTLPASTLYQLGLITADEYVTIAEQVANGEEAAELSWDYEEICEHAFYLVTAADRYVEHEDGTFSYVDDSSLSQNHVLENSVKLTITGVIRPSEDAVSATIATPVAYTSKLTDYVIGHTNNSPIVVAQENSPEINVLNGMKFEALDDAEKIEDAKAYLSAMGVSDKASMYQMIQYYQMQGSQGDSSKGSSQSFRDSTQMDVAATDEVSQAAAMDKWLSETPDDKILLDIYEEYIEGASYEDNMEAFGKVSYDAPASISIYADSFENKEAISDCIARYNDSADAESQIVYTDYVELMTSSLTSIIDIISYILIAFVAVSLVVSCIMIGIITHISVIERTKEIGILRAMGASKRNIAQVFNAETCIIGCCAGILGVGISALLTIPINAILGTLLDASTLNVSLPASYALLLIVLSVLITIIGGLLPAKSAAKKDLVVALRTE